MADRLPRLSQGGGRGRPFFAGAGRWAGPFTRRRSNPACKDTNSRPNLGKKFFSSPLSTSFLPSVFLSLCTLFFFSPPQPEFALHFKADGERLSFYVFVCGRGSKT